MPGSSPEAAVLLRPENRTRLNRKNKKWLGRAALMLVAAATVTLSTHTESNPDANNQKLVATAAGPAVLVSLQATADLQTTTTTTTLPPPETTVPATTEPKPAPPPTPTTEPPPVSNGSYDCGDNYYAAYIYGQESGGRIVGNCDPKAENASGCLGIGQACPGSKLTNVCPDLDYACENEFFTAYAINRYGGWEQAYNHWIAHGSW
jgi:hypothetical protein